MILISLALFAIGVCLSALFSGSETGFYRASRIRLVMDGLDGDPIARQLLRLVNNPTLFVATCLVGNNVANNLTSLSIVLFTRAVYVNDSGAAEMAAPILLSPLLFVYGELMPKNLFYNAPNRLLRQCGPLLLIFTVVFVPVSAILWALARLLEGILGASPAKIRLALARQELQEVLDESQEAGILHPTQRDLGQNFFLVASKPVRSVCTPLPRTLPIARGTRYALALKHARKHSLADLPVYHQQRNNIIGFVRTIDLLLANDPQQQVETTREMIEIPADELFGEALLTMQASRETIARVVADGQGTIGILSIDQLTDPLLKGQLGSLRR